MPVRPEPVDVVGVGNANRVLPPASHMDALERRKRFRHQRRRVLGERWQGGRARTTERGQVSLHRGCNVV